MRHTLTAILIPLMVYGGVASAGPLEYGLAAYDRADYATALKLFQPLAEEGNAAAQYHLGLMYYLGQGVARDYKEAVKWYRLAAEQGYAVAQHNLGLIYKYGQGIARDYVRAYMWIDLAASVLTGDEANQAASDRELVAQRMTPAQIAEAKEMARKCDAANFKQCD